MTILIWGAGAIGGTVGAFLARAGQDVHFVDVAAEHVDAINLRGLSIKGPIADFTVEATASLPAALSGQYRTILLCVKSQHTLAAAEALKPFLADDGCVVSLQNGLNELVIADVVGQERTVGAFVNFSADYHAPGEILYGGRGAVVLGELDGGQSERLRALHDLLLDFEPGAIMTDEIWAYLWGKEAYGAMLFLSALTHQSIAEALADDLYRPLYMRAAQEILRLAEGLGIAAKGFNGFEPAAFLAEDGAGMARSLDALVAFNRLSSKTHSGIWRDLAVRMRPTEVAMYDPLLTQADSLALPLPLTRRWIGMIREIESGAREQSRDNLEELRMEFV